MLFVNSLDKIDWDQLFILYLSSMGNRKYILKILLDQFVEGQILQPEKIFLPKSQFRTYSVHADFRRFFQLSQYQFSSDRIYNHTYFYPSKMHNFNQKKVF